MAESRTKELSTIPAGRLGVVAHKSCEELGKEVDKWLVKWRKERESEHKDTLSFEGYERDTYLIKNEVPRFGSGEAKGVIEESVRGDDLYFMVDVCNHSMTYPLQGNTIVNYMSPDDHFQDLKRLIAAASGKAKRMNVIMPYLYEGRVSLRGDRESLDCASALQELVDMGVENIITFDAHDVRVQNATPLYGLETVRPAYQFVKALFGEVEDIEIDKDKLMIISPDRGGMDRAIYLATVLHVNMGMFYKRRSIEDVKNAETQEAADTDEANISDVQAEQQEAKKEEDINADGTIFLGPSVKGMDVIIVDDMISSGTTVLETARKLSKAGAKRVFICASFGLFTRGLDAFDKAFKKKYFYKLLTTNMIYQPEELKDKEYYIKCDMSKYIALIIDTLNHEKSLSSLLNPYDRITNYVEAHKAGKNQEESEPESKPESELKSESESKPESESGAN